MTFQAQTETKKESAILNVFFDALSILLALPVFLLLGTFALVFGAVLSVILIVSMIFSLPIGCFASLFRKRPADENK